MSNEDWGSRLRDGLAALQSLADELPNGNAAEVKQFEPHRLAREATKSWYEVSPVDALRIALAHAGSPEQGVTGALIVLRTDIGNLAFGGGITDEEAVFLAERAKVASLFRGGQSGEGGGS